MVSNSEGNALPQIEKPVEIIPQQGCNCPLRFTANIVICQFVRVRQLINLISIKTLGEVGGATLRFSSEI